MPSERWLEFHDSKLTAVRRTPGGTCFELEAYIHQWEGVGTERRGTGWIQPVQIEIRGAEPVMSTIALPVDLSDGRVVAASLREDDAGTLTIPIVLDENVTLEFAPISGATFRTCGTRLAATMSGEARFVENLPSDMDPARRAAAPGDA